MVGKVLITGITGQDGGYLAKLLLENNYQVFGTERRSSSKNNWRLKYLNIDKHLENIDLELLEESNIFNTVKKYQFDAIYNLAAQSHVWTSFQNPIYTAQVNSLGVARFLEAIRIFSPQTRFYQASTSEMFGSSKPPQSENTVFHPRSPYGVSKLYSHWLTVNYRESYDMHASSGILFNHESPLRGQDFVTRKITTSLARIKYGQQEYIELGNLDAQRDWGFAGDYVKAMYMMMNSDKADDYVIATGKAHTVREFCSIAARTAGINIEWKGIGKNEEGIDSSTGKTIVKINEKFYRPAEVDVLIGDATKAKKQLGWKAETDFSDLVIMMVEADMQRVKDNLIIA